MARGIAGYGRCPTDFMTGKGRDYGRFAKPELCRAALCEGKLREKSKLPNLSDATSVVEARQDRLAEDILYID